LAVTNPIYSGTNDTFDLSVPITWTISLTSAPVNPLTCAIVSGSDVQCLVPSVTSTGGPTADGKYDFAFSVVGPANDHTSMATLYYTDGGLYNQSEVDQRTINP
jgi:hypothetical protein